MCRHGLGLHGRCGQQLGDTERPLNFGEVVRSTVHFVDEGGGQWKHTRPRHMLWYGRAEELCFQAGPFLVGGGSSEGHPNGTLTHVNIFKA